jgi:signal transduction histidine kinase
VDYVIFSSLDDTIYFLTPSLASVLGYNVKDLLATSVCALIDPDDLLKLKTLPADGRGKGAFNSWEPLRLAHQNGSWRSVKVVQDVLVGQSGSLVVLGIELTHNTNEWGSQECDQLPSVLDMQSVTSQIAHDLRTPLTVMKQALFLLEETISKDNEIKKYIQWIKEASQSIMDVVLNIHNKGTSLRAKQRYLLPQEY